MLTEKEEIRRIRKSLKAGRTKEQISNSLMAKGYKYDYVSALISKSGSTQKVLTWLVIVLLVIGLGSWGIYGNFFKIKNIQLNLTNPMEGIRIAAASSENNFPPMPGDPETTTLEIGEIVVATEFIDYLLGVIEAQNYLHSVPLSNNQPIINFETEDKEFHSIVDEGIDTDEGSSNEADLNFYIPNEVVIRTTASDDPKEYFLEEIADGKVQIETLASETELFSKGYLNFYNSLTAE